MTRRLYLDNSATSFPKPPEVLAAMTHFATDLGASPGRGAYTEAREAGALLHRCRQRIATLVNGAAPEQVIFTLNASDALNLAIRGLLRPGDHVITTRFEHNSVLRPLNRLMVARGIEQTRVACDPVTGLVDPDLIRRAIRPGTRLVAVVHASNVTGTLQPIADIGRLAREHGVPFLVDAAQSLGHVPLDVERDCIDMLAFPGHKGLLGPLGTGALYLRPGLERLLHTIREGGTGSASDRDVQPDFLPDRFEPGSHNAIGLIGLSAGVAWVLEHGVDTLHQQERDLVQAMLEGLATVPGLTLYGPRSVAHRTGVFSIRMTGFAEPQALSDRLEQGYGILSRSGVHCAPLAHETIGTLAVGGTTRLSLGPFVTREDVTYVLEALHGIARSTAVAP
ncbi:MAG: aminotransferase class V-fold PLP-dependent enzyme [Polyangiaceae bacterium]|nr:aminotransferase class V-fold PLP-dependent enzyme [Polyangiaceae bacterium]